MSFFIRTKSRASKGKKRGAKGPVASSKTASVLKKPKHDDNDLLSESDEEVTSSDGDNSSITDQDDADAETPQEKRLRLAKEYLDQIAAEEKARRHGDSSASEDDEEDLVGKRLKKDLSELSGKFHKKVADQYVCPEENDIIILKGHRLPLTCVVISPDDRHVFTGSKDGCIIKYDVASGKRLHVMRVPSNNVAASRAPAKLASAKGGQDGGSSKPQRAPQILCMALSSDGKYLACGCQDNLIHILNPDTCEPVHTFRGHKGAVTALTFRRSTHDLYSGSTDRLVKVWNLDEMAYVETLFGHQDVVTGIDSLLRERAVSSGGRDNTVRVWKIAEESQLVFNGLGGSIDCVALIDEEHFVSGDDTNSLALWSVMKKKPVCRLANAHKSSSGADGGSWITCVASMTHTDLLASGSNDGQLRLWKIEGHFHKLAHLFSVTLPGFVNSIRFSHRGDFAVAAAGQEHRLGRWWRMTGGAKNVAYVVRLPQKQPPGEA